MRILALEDVLYARGGQEVSLFDICSGLTGRGHRIVLLYRSGGTFENEYRRMGVDMRRVRTYSPERPYGLGSMIRFLSSLGRGLGTRPDVVYANEYSESLYGAIVAGFNGVPYVCHLRLPPPDRLCRQHRLGLAGTRYFIAVSRETRQLWIQRGLPGDKVAVVYNGVNLERFPFSEDPAPARKKIGIPEDAYVVVYAGRLGRAKGTDILIEAFSILKKAVPRAYLVISGRSAEPPKAGESNFLAALQAAARSQGVADSIMWRNHTQDMPKLYAAADVTVLPSVWPEPFGRILIESMACGTPVVASRTGGIPEVLFGEMERSLVEKGNAQALAEKLREFVDWRERYPQWARQCRDFVAAHFDAKRTVNEVEEIFLKTSRKPA